MDFTQSLQSLIPGATGRVLAVLSGISMPLSGRAVAELAGISSSQAARVLPKLVDLGVVEAQDAPPAMLYALATEHVAARHLRALRHLDRELVDRLRDRVTLLDPAPVTVAIFGSFARGEAGLDSDIDVLVVRPDDVDEEDDHWRETVEAVWTHAAQLSGNSVDIIEYSRQDAHDRLGSRRELWRNIRSEALIVHGLALDAI